MGRRGIQLFDDKADGFLSISGLGSHWSDTNNNGDIQCFPGGGLFASVGMGFPNSNENGGMKSFYSDLYDKYLSFVGFKEEEEDEEGMKKRKKKGWLKVKIKVRNPSLRRLLSGGIAGAVSRTAVAPLETIRTHLMVGSSGHTSSEVFQNIMQHDGWTGLFRGNLVNVIRVAPSKAIELFAYDTVNKKLSPGPGEQAKLPIPASLIAGACAGVTSTLCTYPLELVKTRLTIQVQMNNRVLNIINTSYRCSVHYAIVIRSHL
ncbi:Adenine nucleotide transporter BT1, chloroplastic/mitochondrial [Linum perenne]